MADEEFYLQVENELKESFKDEALWSKAKHLAKEDEKETEIQYTKLRVTQLKVESAKNLSVDAFAWLTKNWLKVLGWGFVLLIVMAYATGNY
jgi:hypothetical protein|tara:strand:+ start:339 stop:614 length:276 start_codon:yes stop_codon:yes gene_type:complete